MKDDDHTEKRFKRSEATASTDKKLWHQYSDGGLHDLKTYVDQLKAHLDAPFAGDAEELLNIWRHLHSVTTRVLFQMTKEQVPNY
jgi:hypothetical protein